MEPKTQKHLPSKQNIFFLFLIQFLVGFCMFSYVRLSDDASFFLCPTSESTVPDEAKAKLVILLWKFPFGAEFPLDQCQESYGISGCYLTANRTWYDRADAVIFHHRDICRDQKQLPQIARPPNQHWIWFNLESPSHSPNLHLMDNLMNFTMSYRLDSDIFTPYGRIEILKEPQNFSIPVKSKLVSWVVSNWNPWSKRVKYYQELKKHIQVDVFGRGHEPLDRDKKFSTISQYKFYLAFENSQHQDYITEKFWSNALQSTTVPVVLGTTRENYERFLPAEAFIHVDDFPNAQELAAYLKLLNSDDEKYQKYFDWRRRLQIAKNGDWNSHFCKACQYLRQKPTYRIIPSVAKWFK
ncbi:3-galactosyl-N-acetylglucosaminide 4-alpha-L-fucosyltransferase FUT3-like [Ambystoma mexicanum]|uniref:3-galactosyl-N-acetylglucosaminide 4-alpha-L-fucosyltransferase FUT3-like n=1 Tax=Ambystoma mexicanum TaxID=8296 RepID=UPI0037E842E8